MYEEEKKFQQRWEFRDVGDKFNDSSSEDDCSTSNKKKHKLLSDMLLLETEEEPFSNSPVSNSRSFRKSKKDKRVVIHSHSPNKKKEKKNKSISLDGLKMFMESMLGELRVERESMFSRMREEMKRIDSTKKVNPKKVSHMRMMMHQKKIEENPETNNGFDSSNGKIERLVKKPLEAGGGTESDMTVGSEIVDLFTSPNISAGFLSGGGGGEQSCKKISMNTTTTNEINGFNLYGGIHHQFSNVGRSGDGFAAVPPLHIGNGNGNGIKNNNVFGLRISGGAIRFSSTGDHSNNNNNHLVTDDNDDEIWQTEAKTYGRET
ncbi:uncharacterized protein LOC124928827 [Impatiens glandulifera]|uniref:uncharacterized protein LOC124928827 n=1 Tax=Impatiens glandulifera TaxID=253017 RepID=UPI001FB0DC16|nr:uncharacterized protein LOC124928827 [Impatiens glandulifera]